MLLCHRIPWQTHGSLSVTNKCVLGGLDLTFSLHFYIFLIFRLHFSHFLNMFFYIFFTFSAQLGGPAAPQTPLLNRGASPPGPPDLNYTKHEAVNRSK